MATSYFRISRVRCAASIFTLARVIRLRDPQISPCLPDIFRSCEIRKLMAMAEQRAKGEIFRNVTN